MTDFLPAWSEPFHRDGLGGPPRLDLQRPITREWAYGDGSGAGVKVAIVDSGVNGASSWTQPPAGSGPTDIIASRTPCSVFSSTCTQRMPNTRW